ncbi:MULTISPECIES: DUF7488 domain-containing protein [unclassified Helicobacter]|uniref:DUF7488 domain-containing protein n=1 Tax=unclassified Helicobacter TaxID=2593540 RepID=UPI000CF0D296|nr:MULTISPECIES: PDZ domain-containing protein [unclassified Helicobacter]
MLKIPFYSFIIFLPFSLLFGMNFSFCQKHYQQVVWKVKDIDSVPILYQDKVYYVAYSKKPLISEYVLRSDPFIGLYLIDAKKNPKGYVLRDLEKKPQDIQIAIIGSKGSKEAKVLQMQEGFLKYGKLNQIIEPNAVLGDICYQIYGIGADNGFIDKKYLERFLSQDEAYYGDIGIRLDKNRVREIDPFFKNNPFKPRDIIIQINDNKITEKTNVEWIVANLAYESKASVSVLRLENGKSVTKTFKVVVKKLFGGYLLQDTFFESQGIKIDKDLVIKRLSKNLNNGLENLKRGDRILWIHKQDPRKLEGEIFSNLRKVLSDTYTEYGFIEMLISRNGFQFSLKIHPNN